MRADNRHLPGLLAGRFGAGQNKRRLREGPIVGRATASAVPNQGPTLEEITQSTCQSDIRRATKGTGQNLSN
jgi:hypothetical protein